MRIIPFTLLLAGITLALPAAAEQPLSPAPLIEAPAFDPSAPAEEEVAAEAGGPSWASRPGIRAARIGVGTLSAATVGLAAGLVSGLGAFAILCGASGACTGWNAMVPVLLAYGVGVVGAAAGIPFGAFLANRLMGGKGGFGWALLGATAALGVGFGLTAVLTSANQGFNSWAGALLVVSAPLGGAVGAELSSWFAERSVAPAVAVGPGGGLVAVTVRF